MTGFTVAQLHALFLHLRIPNSFVVRRRHTFNGEESLLHYLYWNRKGGTKLEMSRNMFGGDSRRFTYSIRYISDHLYKTFYHKVSGDSMRMWVPHIESFRRAIWHKLVTGATIEEDGRSGDRRQITLDIPFETFRIFGFIDDTGFRTTAPGREARRVYGFFDDVQRSFYSGYFAGHGMKVQVVSLPNGMVGSIYIASWRVSDTGLLNMSDLDTYLTNLFQEYSMQMPIHTRDFPALYGDGIFPNLNVLVSRDVNVNDETRLRTTVRLNSVRQSIEHLFALHWNIFALFNEPDRFRLLVSGVEVYKMIFNSFLLLNCYICFNESLTHFVIRPLSIEEYLPLDEIIPEAPHVPDDQLGTVYRYHGL